MCIYTQSPTIEPNWTVWIWTASLSRFVRGRLFTLPSVARCLQFTPSQVAQAHGNAREQLRLWKDSLMSLGNSTGVSEYVWVQLGKLNWLRLVTLRFAPLQVCEALIRLAFFKTGIHMILVKLLLHSCTTQSSFDPFQWVMHMVIQKTKCRNRSVFSAWGCYHIMGWSRSYG